MANYVCSVRSNYVRVKDEQAFKDFVEDFECELIRAEDGRVGFVCDNADGCAPYRYSDEEGEHVFLVDCEEEIGRHLCDGEVLVIEEVRCAFWWAPPTHSTTKGSAFLSTWLTPCVKRWRRNGALSTLLTLLTEEY